MEKRQKFTLNLGFLRYREQLVHKMFVLDHFQIYRVTQKKTVITQTWITFEIINEFFLFFRFTK